MNKIKKIRTIRNISLAVVFMSLIIFSLRWIGVNTSDTLVRIVGSLDLVAIVVMSFTTMKLRQF